MPINGFIRPNISLDGYRYMLKSYELFNPVQVCICGHCVGRITAWSAISHRAVSAKKILKAVISAVIMVQLCACSPQISTEINHDQFNLTADDLRAGGIAFITPSTVTGQEEEKQAVAFVFAATLIKERPDLNVITLPQTLSLINSAGLADEHKEMYKEYRDSGIFSRKTLLEIATAGGIRYLAQLKLAGFSQSSKDRFGFFGLRMVQTKSATGRLFFQLWDAQQGVISWESVEELSWAEEKISENPITLQTIMVRAAQDIAERLPR